MAGWLELVSNRFQTNKAFVFRIIYKNRPTDDIRYEDNHYRYTQSKNKVCILQV